MRIITLGTTTTLVSLSGCAALSGPASEAKVKNEQTAPSEYNIDCELEMTNSRYSEDSPVQLKVSYTNIGTDRRISNCAPFVKRERASLDASLWLCHPNQVEISKDDKKQWQVDTEVDPDQIPLGVCTLGDFNANDTISEQYYLLDNSNTRGYLTPGSYTWETTVVLAGDGPTPKDPSKVETESFTWGFTIELL